MFTREGVTFFALCEAWSISYNDAWFWDLFTCWTMEGEGGGEGMVAYAGYAISEKVDKVTGGHSRGFAIW